MWLLKIIFSALASTNSDSQKEIVRRHVIDGKVYTEEVVSGYLFLRGRDGLLKPFIDQYGKHVRV